MPKNVIVGPYSNCMFSFLKKKKKKKKLLDSFLNGYTIYIPSSNEQVIQFLVILTSICCYHYFLF